MIAGTTEATGWHRVWAHRRTTFETDGSLVGTVEKDRVPLRSDGRPMRIPDEITRLLAPAATYRPRRIDPGDPPPAAARTTVTVRDADVNPLGHLNNAAYLDLVDETMPAVDGDEDGENGQYRNYHAEFVTPVARGATVVVATWQRDDDSVAARIVGSDGRERFRAVVR